MQEARLRRDADRQFRRRDQDRLAQLPIPGAECGLDALEGGDLELGLAHVGDERLCIRRLGARRRLADRAHGHPRVVIDRAHGAVGEALEAVLELRAAP